MASKEILQIDDLAAKAKRFIDDVHSWQSEETEDEYYARKVLQMKNGEKTWFVGDTRVSFGWGYHFFSGTTREGIVVDSGDGAFEVWKTTEQGFGPIKTFDGRENHDEALVGAVLEIDPEYFTRQDN